MRLNKVKIGLLALTVMSTVACKKEQSSSTGWNYNDSKWGGFEKHEYAGQEYIYSGNNVVLF